MNTRDEQITNTVPVEPYREPLQPLPRAPLVRYATPSLPSIEDADVPQHNALVTTYRVGKRVLGKWLLLGLGIVLTATLFIFNVTQYYGWHSNGSPCCEQWGPIGEVRVFGGLRIPLTTMMLVISIVGVIQAIAGTIRSKYKDEIKRERWSRLEGMLTWLVLVAISLIVIYTTPEQFYPYAFGM